MFITILIPFPQNGVSDEEEEKMLGTWGTDIRKEAGSVGG